MNQNKIQNLFYEHSPVGYMVITADESRFVAVNPAFLKITGYSREDLIGKTTIEVGLWGRIEEREQVRKEIFKNGSYEHLAGFKCKDQTIKSFFVWDYLVKDDDQSYICVVLSDLAQVMKLEQLEKVSREKFEAIARLAKDAVILIDKENNVKFWNKAAELMFGYMQEEVLELDCHKFIAPQRYHSEYLKGWKKFIVDGKGPLIGKTVEVFALKKDGGEFPIELSISSFWMDNQWNALGIIRDLTERKKMDKQKEDLHRQIVLNSKLLSLGELTAGLAHEINNPLAIMSGNLFILEKNLRDISPNLLKAVETIKDSVKRITKIIQNLRLYSKTETGYRNYINVHEVIFSALEIARATLSSENIEVNLSLGAERFFVNWNEAELQQVVINLLSNSKDALRSNKNPFIDIRSYNSNEKLVISIKDNGCGIAEDVKNRIFDPFFSTKPVGQGTGMGLNIVHALVHGANGKIDFMSRIGEGSEFIIELPLVPQI